jgi:hypothetical protein
LKRSINVEQFKKAASNSELMKANVVSSAIIENPGAAEKKEASKKSPK